MHECTVGVRFREMASVTQGALARMISNIGGPCPLKSRIILVVVTSTIQYACPIWSEEVTCERQGEYCRYTLIQINGFRTMSDEAVLILVSPIDILAYEIRSI